MRKVQPYQGEMDIEGTSIGIQAGLPSALEWIRAKAKEDYKRNKTTYGPGLFGYRQAIQNASKLYRKEFDLPPKRPSKYINLDDNGKRLREQYLFKRRVLDGEFHSKVGLETNRKASEAYELARRFKQRVERVERVEQGTQTEPSQGTRTEPSQGAKTGPSMGELVHLFSQAYVPVQRDRSLGIRPLSEEQALASFVAPSMTPREELRELLEERERRPSREEEEDEPDEIDQESRPSKEDLARIKTIHVQFKR